MVLRERALRRSANMREDVDLHDRYSYHSSPQNPTLRSTAQGQLHEVDDLFSSDGLLLMKDQIGTLARSAHPATTYSQDDGVELSAHDSFSKLGAYRVADDGSFQQQRMSDTFCKTSRFDENQEDFSQLKPSVGEPESGRKNLVEFGASQSYDENGWAIIEPLPRQLAQQRIDYLLKEISDSD